MEGPIGLSSRSAFIVWPHPVTVVAVTTAEILRAGPRCPPRHRKFLD